MWSIHFSGKHQLKLWLQSQLLQWWRGFHKRSFSGIQHVMTFCGIGIYLLSQLKNLDYSSITHYTTEDGDLCLRAMHVFWQQTEEWQQPSRHFHRNGNTEMDCKALLKYAKSNLHKLTNKTNLQILESHIKITDHDRNHSCVWWLQFFLKSG